MKSINLLFPHQLFEKHEIYDNGAPIYLVEESLFFKEFNFHKVKLVFHRASMKSHQAYLESKNLEVIYIDSSDKRSDISVLIKKLGEEGVEKIHFINPTDNWLEKRFSEAIKETQIDVSHHENPLFINTREDLKHFFKPDKKSFFQTTFYKQQRSQRDILIDADGNPTGGKWSFDGENRKKYPKDKTPPSIHYPETDKFWSDAVDYVDEHFDKNLGQLPKSKTYPTTRDETKKWLEQFFNYRFHGFGDYEDAIVTNESYLHHSVLTPMMNVGLIQPKEVIEEAVKYANDHDVAINDLEGFIRQILGWREFIRGMYEAKGSFSRTKNFWGFDRKIPASFYDGTTGIDPIDMTIKQILNTGYCHHIERLMVLGNFMLLCEFDPKEVYRWFMELFIDAYDWVMVPNVYGMSQFADGGLFATKPYISGSNYLMKMSNYKKGDWQVTWDGLFWRFMHINRDFFLKNPRLGMLVRTFDKMEEDKKKAHLENGQAFLDAL
ncbi:cryptochrome/photolyase family protein [Roseivirga misakiensis]|uniref:Deoxyribodipyrimidine photolyase n=1 Tax=Roseivirga misakiensis TaxID=1563681 RepID=A0A1E5SKT5_9BACT|nr:cryptochrome/photolyase family protein [Roseivirga misakiensis]OEJ99735.1 deoxyribodipyrimidine photolyase [Roseivirga misakiensis]